MKDRPKNSKEEEYIDNLRDFLKHWKDNQQLSINELAKRHLKFHLPDDDKLITSTLSRFLNDNKKPRQTTITQIARVVLNDRDATLEQLNSKIEKFLENRKRGINTIPDTSIRIGTGWTVWSSLVVSLIARQSSLDNDRTFAIPDDIKITLSDKDANEPFWIQNAEEIDTLISIKDDIKKKYIAENLEDKLDSEAIDAAFLLRPTFDSMKFHRIRRPLLVARIAVGHGTHLYCISRKAPGEKNAYVSMKTIDEQSKAVNTLVETINTKYTVTVTIGNETVEEHRKKLFNLPRIAPQYRENRRKISFEDKDVYNRNITEIAALIKDRDAVILIIAFEPLNNIIFNHLRQSLLKQKSDIELKYSNFNLSKLVDDRSAYGLYVNHDLVEDRTKFKTLVNFLKALDNYEKSFPRKEELKDEIARFVGAMYYPSGNPADEDSAPVHLMKNSLEEISYSIQFLPFLEKFVELRG